MKLEEIAVADLVPYENNPRKNDSAVEAVANSIREFGFKVPIIIDAENVIVAGHTRLRAAEVLGLESVPVIRADDLTEEQVRAFRLADNKTAELADWDFAKLEEELNLMDDFNMDQFGFETMIEADDILAKYSDGEQGSLSKKFVVPPFSVLNTAGGVWQDRKKYWADKIDGDLSETRDGEYGVISGGVFKAFNGGTSNFDPVLAEVMYKWFCTEGGKVLDPWGGEQTKGVVAGELGYKYRACEIREDQVQVNQEATQKYKDVNYVCGDSNNILKLIKDREFDMLFSSPPYYDLEVYSKDDMSALGTYEEFIAQYSNILSQCYAMLADNSFAVIKVGEIRDKKTGLYRNFVSDTIRVMIEAGFSYYNEIILVNPVGTAAIRANVSMKTRKVVKRHQNVLVFYKGDAGMIADKFPELEFPEGIDEDGIE